MTISSNTITLDALTLPYELVWTDKYQWTGIVSGAERTLQGVNIVEQNQLSGESGRKITLESDQAWITKTDLNTLHSWAQILNKEMTLTFHDSTSYTVRFNHDDGEPITAEPIKQIAEQSATDEYILTLKLIVV